MSSSQLSPRSLYYSETSGLPQFSDLLVLVLVKTNFGFGLGQDQFLQAPSSPGQGRLGLPCLGLGGGLPASSFPVLSKTNSTSPLAMVQRVGWPEGHPARPVRGILWCWSCRNSGAEGLSRTGHDSTLGIPGDLIAAPATRPPTFFISPLSPSLTT